MESHYPDHSLTDKEDWYNVIKDIEDGLLQTPFDEYGNYRNRTVPTPVTVLPQSPILILMDYPLGLNTHLESPQFPLTLMRRISTSISMIVTSFASFQSVTQFNDTYVVCEADTSEVVIATPVDLPRSNRRHRT
jgi:hypothetical protein